MYQMIRMHAKTSQTAGIQLGHFRRCFGSGTCSARTCHARTCILFCPGPTQFLEVQDALVCWHQCGWHSPVLRIYQLLLPVACNGTWAEGLLTSVTQLSPARPCNAEAARLVGGGEDPLSYLPAARTVVVAALFHVVALVMIFCQNPPIRKQKHMACRLGASKPSSTESLLVLLRQAQAACHVREARRGVLNSTEACQSLDGVICEAGQQARVHPNEHQTDACFTVHVQLGRKIQRLAVSKKFVEARGRPW
mmetsp:Transcript_104384/g.248363  ORF Transcript_104384/g.248363 Transcript_104384/m.248363 type:complete len:251 (+) Transcript_104384:96-848(+)